MNIFCSVYYVDLYEFRSSSQIIGSFHVLIILLKSIFYKYSTVFHNDSLTYPVDHFCRLVFGKFRKFTKNKDPRVQQQKTSSGGFISKKN